MLSIVHTAEAQFRHESAQRDRELMLRARIRERQAALQELKSVRPHVLRPAAAAVPRLVGVPRPITVPRLITLPSSRRHAATWARPIGAAAQHRAAA